MLSQTSLVFPRMPFRLCIAFFVIALQGSAWTDPALPSPEQRNAVSLDGLWKFCPAFKELEMNHEFLQRGLEKTRTYASEEIDKNYGWIEPDFDSAHWLDIAVPASWNTQFEDLWSYEGQGWYRKDVVIPTEWAGRRVVFVSDGANYRTVLYVNGSKVGVHEGGFLRFSFPIHEYARFGAVNTIAIAVDNESRLDRVPMERHDWWNHGGLYRSVRLEASDRTHITDAAIVTDALSDPALVRVSARCATEVVAERVYKVVARLRDASGNEVATSSEPLVFEGKGGNVEIELAVKDADLWSPDHPYLYGLTLELREADTSICRDTWTHSVGIRTITIDGAALLLNGEPFLVRGVNRYENYAETGMTSTEDALLADLRLIKGLGANAVRCHYPNSPRTYELYDQMGLFTICEIPLYQWGRPGHSVKNLEAAKAQLEEMILNLRNHPSVMMWSVSNETRIRPRAPGEEHRKLSEMVAAGNIELVEMAHRFDPTRPVIEPSNRWPDDVVFSKTDLNAPNVYLGASAPHTEFLGELGDAVGERFAALREMHPNKPVLVTEFGGWALRGFKADHFPGEGYQAKLLETYWRAFLKEPDFVGGFIWVFADSDVHRKFTGIYETRCAYGLFDLHRRGKESAAMVRELWGGDTPAH